MTAQAHNANNAQVQALQDLIETSDMEQLAFDNRERVRQYYQQKMGINTTDEVGQTGRGSSGSSGMSEELDAMGHVLGDVTVSKHEPKSTAAVLANTLVPLAAIGLAGALAWKMLDTKTTPVVPVVPPAENTDKVTTVVPGFGEPNPRPQP